MPTYQYQCDKGHVFEVVQSIHADALQKCECGAQCERIVTGGYLTIFPGKTLGTVAERNSAKLGTYEKDKINKPVEDFKAQRKAEAPWWRPNTTGPMTELNKKTPEQVERYIMEGK